jgi:protein-tyrosine-phosphatase
MAEHLLVRRLRESGVPPEAIEVSSGGIAPYARDGSLVSLDTRFALRDVDLHLEEGLGARDLKRGHRHLLQEADLILTMTTEQIGMLREYLDREDTPLMTLREFAGLGGDIDDPAGQSESAFAFARDQISHALDHALPRLVPHANAPDSCPICRR